MKVVAIRMDSKGKNKKLRAFVSRGKNRKQVFDLAVDGMSSEEIQTHVARMTESLQRADEGQGE